MHFLVVVVHLAVPLPVPLGRLPPQRGLPAGRAQQPLGGGVHPLPAAPHRPRDGGQAAVARLVLLHVADGGAGGDAGALGRAEATEILPHLAQLVGVRPLRPLRPRLPLPGPVAGGEVDDGVVGGVGVDGDDAGAVSLGG